MSTLLSGTNAADRLVEALAGSTALAANPDVGTTSSLLGSDPTGDDADTAGGSPSQGTGEASPLADVLQPVTSLLGGSPGGATEGGLPVIGHLIEGGGLGQDSLLTLAGPDGTAQPILNAANALIKDFHNNVLEALSHDLGANNLVHSITEAGETIGLGQIGVPTPSPTDGHTNLVTDLINAPGTLLDGGLGTVISQIGADLTDDIRAVDGIVSSLINTPGGINVVPTLLQEVGHDLQSLPLLSINGDGSGGGLLDGLVGNLNGSDTGHLVDVNVGPEQPNGQSIDILAAPTAGDHHAIDVSAIDVGQNGPHLLDLNALTGSDGLGLPALSGTGTDGLAGNLLGNLNLNGLLCGGIASGTATNAPLASAPVDLSAMLHDLTASPIGADHGILDAHGTPIL